MKFHLIELYPNFWNWEGCLFLLISLVYNIDDHHSGPYILRICCFWFRPTTFASNLNISQIGLVNIKLILGFQCRCYNRQDMFKSNSEIYDPATSTFVRWIYEEENSVDKLKSDREEKSIFTTPREYNFRHTLHVHVFHFHHFYSRLNFRLSPDNFPYLSFPLKHSWQVSGVFQYVF